MQKRCPTNASESTATIILASFDTVDLPGSFSARCVECRQRFRYGKDHNGRIGVFNLIELVNHAGTHVPANAPRQLDFSHA